MREKVTYQTKSFNTDRQIDRRTDRRGQDRCLRHIPGRIRNIKFNEHLLYEANRDAQVLEAEDRTCRSRPTPNVRGRTEQLVIHSVDVNISVSAATECLFFHYSMFGKLRTLRSITK